MNVELRRAVGFGNLDPRDANDPKDVKSAKVDGRYQSRLVLVHVRDDGVLKCSDCDEEDCRHERAVRDNVRW